MKTLIRNALLVTINRQNDVIENGSIVIDGNKLVYVGPTRSMPTGPFDKTIEGDRYIAMPGMVNAHCHSPANLVRGMLPSKPLEIWRAYYRASLRDMRDEDFYASALLGGMEMLKNGATTVLDHFFGNQACRFMGVGAAIQAMRDLGLRHVISLTLSDKNYEETIPLGETASNVTEEIKRMSASEAKATKAWLDDCEEFIDTFHDPDEVDDLLSGTVGGPALLGRASTGGRGHRAQKEIAAAPPSRRNESSGSNGQTAVRDFVASALGFVGCPRPESFFGTLSLDRACRHRTFCQERRDTGSQSCEQLTHR